MKTFICLLLLCVPTFAKTHAPLPPEVAAAKTVYIVNQTGNQDILDSAYEAVSKWGRFTVASDKNHADLFMTFQNGERIEDGNMMTRIQMLVSLPSAEDAVFQVADDGMGLHLRNSRGPIAAKNCVEKFRARIEGK